MTCSESTVVRRIVGFIPFALIGGIIFSVMDDMDTAIPFFIIGGIGVVLAIIVFLIIPKFEEKKPYVTPKGYVIVPEGAEPPPGAERVDKNKLFSQISDSRIQDWVDWGINGQFTDPDDFRFVEMTLKNVKKKIKRKTVEEIFPIADELINEPKISLAYRLRRIVAFAYLKDIRTVPPLINQLSNPDARIRTVVARALGYIGDSIAIAPLKQLQNTETEEFVKTAIAVALIQLQQNSN